MESVFWRGCKNLYFFCHKSHFECLCITFHALEISPRFRTFSSQRISLKLSINLKYFLSFPQRVLLYKAKQRLSQNLKLGRPLEKVFVILLNSWQNIFRHSIWLDFVTLIYLRWFSPIPTSLKTKVFLPMEIYKQFLWKKKYSISVWVYTGAGLGRPLAISIRPSEFRRSSWLFNCCRNFWIPCIYWSNSSCLSSRRKLTTWTANNPYSVYRQFPRFIAQFG